MTNERSKEGQLAENAYRPLNSGEECHLVVSASVQPKMVTAYSVGWGILFDVRDR